MCNWLADYSVRYTIHLRAVTSVPVVVSYIPAVARGQVVVQSGSKSYYSTLTNAEVFPYHSIHQFSPKPSNRPRQSAD